MRQLFNRVGHHLSGFTSTRPFNAFVRTVPFSRPPHRFYESVPLHGSTGIPIPSASMEAFGATSSTVTERYNSIFALASNHAFS